MSRRRLGDLPLALAIGVLVLAPLLLRRGFALRGDLIFVPHQPWKPAWLGLDGGVPRFVPGDALVSVATSVVPGDLLEKAVLLGALVLAGVGAGRLVSSYGGVARSAGVVVYVWNPWVLERLSIGQWGSVVGYAALPWVVTAAARLRDDPRRGWPATVAWLGFTALWSPAAGLTGALTALCVVAVRPRPWPVAAVLGGTVVVNLPWLVPSLAVDQFRSVGPGFAAFTASAESSAGLVASLLSFGGIWKTAVVPGERTLAVIVVLACVPTVVALVSLRRARAAADPAGRTTISGLLLLAVVTFALVLLPALGPLTGALDRASGQLAPIGVIRDSQRFLGPAVLVVVPGVAAATDWLWSRGRPGAEAVRALALLLLAWPALCLPSLAWGLAGALEPVQYPGDWTAVAGRLDDGDTTVVLPWRGGYRGYDWNQDRAMLDPAPRFLPGDVLIDDRLYVGDQTLGNEEPRLAAVTAALATSDPASSLRRIGVTHVLVESGNGVRASDVPSGRVDYDGRWLTLVDLGPVTGPLPGQEPSRLLVGVADVVALLALLVSTGLALRCARGHPV